MAGKDSEKEKGDHEEQGTVICGVCGQRVEGTPSDGRAVPVSHNGFDEKLCPGGEGAAAQISTEKKESHPRFAILNLKGYDGTIPTTNQVRDIFVPWSLEKGWRLAGFARLEKYGIMVSLSNKGDEDPNPNKLIAEFCEYIREKYANNRKDNESAGYPSLYLTNIEVMYFARSNEQDKDIFTAMVLQRILESIPQSMEKVKSDMIAFAMKFKDFIH